MAKKLLGKEVNEALVASLQTRAAALKEKGITPVLSTIPCVPDRINEAKNAWVRASGYRYIDFNRAVGADKSKEWYPGMICPDLVHPAANGAAALYSQVLIDFPEIMKR